VSTRPWLITALSTVAACTVGPPPRYAASPDVVTSAQRAVVVGTVVCEDLWSHRGLGDVSVELYAEGGPAPLARATSARDGGFALASAYVAAPARRGQLRVTGRGWRGVVDLTGDLGQTYTVVVRVLCEPGRPAGSALLAAAVALQPMPQGFAPQELPRFAGRREYYDLHHSW
jgi:hypothetical protein